MKKEVVSYSGFSMMPHARVELLDKKLLMPYRKKLPESALANIFKKRVTEIRERILKLLS